MTIARIIRNRATGALDADADWINRSTEAGVCFFDGFDAGITGYVNGDNGVRGFHDTSIKVGSGGSLRFDLRAGESGANISGAYTKTSAPWLFTRGFGQGETLYLQYRVRLTASMLTNLSQWNSVWKQIIIHQGNVTCANIEITHTHPDNGSTIYVDCGVRHCYTALDSPDHTENTPLLWQQAWDIDGGGPPWGEEPGGVSSQYPTVNWVPPANEWYTMYYKIHVGTLTVGGTVKDSTIEVWSQEGASYARKKIIACRIGLKYDNDVNDVFNNATITPYMTALSVAADTDASMWIDELIVSASPIAAAVKV